MTAIPARLSRSICWKSCSISISVSEEVGSSMTIRRALNISAREISTICCLAMDRFLTSVRTSTSMSILSMVACASETIFRSSRNNFELPMISRPMKRLSNTVMLSASDIS